MNIKTLSNKNIKKLPNNDKYKALPWMGKLNFWVIADLNMF